jgi:stringent starvation protein B
MGFCRVLAVGRAMDDSERPSKQKSFLSMLTEGWVSLHLDARRPGVVVPGPFASHPHLVLQYGRNMPIPIPDLEVTEAGVSATLSFSRVPHRTYVPWSAVYVISCTNASGVLYREDLPVELHGFGEPVVADAVSEGGAEVSAPPPEPVKQVAVASQWLHSVPRETEEEIESDGMVMHTRRRRRPSLRLVK